MFPSILILISKVSSFGSKWISEAFLAKLWAKIEFNSWIAGASSSLLSMDVADKRLCFASSIGIALSKDKTSSKLEKLFFL